MKGTLRIGQSGWIVVFKPEELWYSTSIPLFPDDADYCLTSDDGMSVEFEVVKECIDEHTNQVQKYAKLLPKNESTDNFDTWNEIFAEIEGSLHVPLPIRVKNWLRNKYHEPKLKYEN